MQARRSLRRKIVVVALVVAMCVGALFLLISGLMRLESSDRRSRELQGLQRQLIVYAERMKREVSYLGSSIKAGSRERRTGLAEEAGEVFARFQESFGGRLAQLPAFEEIQEEWDELSHVPHDPSRTGNGGGNWERYATDLEAFGLHLADVRKGLGGGAGTAASGSPVVV